MYSSQLNYVPLAWPFFSFLVGLFLVLVVLIQVHALRFAYMRLGVSSGAALLLLLASLLGSYINIPVASLPEQRVVTDQEISFFGMRYEVPVLVDWPGTVIAVNVGGAVIPALLSLYLLAKNNLWGRGLLATGCVAAVCYLLAQPVLGVGIAIPTFAPPFVTAVVAFLVAETNIAAVAYISGSLGTLIGADLLNLGKIQGMGAPVDLDRWGGHFRRHLPHWYFWRCYLPASLSDVDGRLDRFTFAHRRSAALKDMPSSTSDDPRLPPGLGDTSL